MQQDVRLNCRVGHVLPALRHSLPAPWALLFSLLLTGCGGGDSDSTSTSMAAPQQASLGPSPLAAQSTSPRGEPTPGAVTDEAAVPSVESASFKQLSALPHLSSLSDREKAGLLMLLPSKSSSQRLALINMYPALVTLPEQQKELLLDQLEKIVPVTVSQRQ